MERHAITPDGIRVGVIIVLIRPAELIAPLLDSTLGFFAWQPAMADEMLSTGRNGDQCHFAACPVCCCSKRARQLDKRHGYVRAMAGIVEQERCLDTDPFGLHQMNELPQGFTGRRQRPVENHFIRAGQFPHASARCPIMDAAESESRRRGRTVDTDQHRPYPSIYAAA